MSWDAAPPTGSPWKRGDPESQQRTRVWKEGQGYSWQGGGSIGGGAPAPGGWKDTSAGSWGSWSSSRGDPGGGGAPGRDASGSRRWHGSQEPPDPKTSLAAFASHPVGVIDSIGGIRLLHPGDDLPPLAEWTPEHIARLDRDGLRAVAASLGFDIILALTRRSAADGSATEFGHGNFRPAIGPEVIWAADAGGADQAAVMRQDRVSVMQIPLPIEARELQLLTRAAAQTICPVGTLTMPGDAPSKTDFIDCDAPARAVESVVIDASLSSGAEDLHDVSPETNVVPGSAPAPATAKRFGGASSSSSSSAGLMPQPATSPSQAPPAPVATTATPVQLTMCLASQGASRPNYQPANQQ